MTDDGPIVPVRRPGEPVPDHVDDEHRHSLAPRAYQVDELRTARMARDVAGAKSASPRYYCPRYPCHDPDAICAWSGSDEARRECPSCGADVIDRLASRDLVGDATRALTTILRAALAAPECFEPAIYVKAAPCGVRAEIMPMNLTATNVAALVRFADTIDHAAAMDRLLDDVQHVADDEDGQIVECEKDLLDATRFASSPERVAVALVRAGWRKA